MVTSTKTLTKKGSGPGGNFPGPNGKKPGGNGWQGGDGSKRKFSPAKYRITMWVVLAAIVMMFAAVSSVYIMSGDEEHARPVTMPPMFFVSTGIILVSSWTLERAKRSLQLEHWNTHLRWLVITLVLGLSFLVSQLLGWQELARAGVYFVGHPKSTFFYIFTGLHGAHLLGGIGLLAYLVIRSRRWWAASEKEKDVVWNAVVSVYWHAMDGIWIWLFLLLLIRK